MTAENLNHFTKEYKHIIQRGVNMNTNFFIDCRWYKTPCKTVLNADAFVVEFLTGEHSIVAKVSDKCYFLSIDNISLSDIKCDFHFSRNYTSPKEFLSKLYDTFNSFLNTSIPFTERHFPHSTDDAIRRILELQEMKKEQFEIVSEHTTKSETSGAETATESKLETATDTETSETGETSESEIGKFVYDAVIHNFYGCDTDTVRADNLERAENKALKRFETENDEEEYYSNDSIRIYEENSDELLKEIIFEPTKAETATESDPKPEINNKKKEINSMYGLTANSSLEINNEYDENKELLAEEQFHSLTKTLIKSLFKAIGIVETRKIHFIISNNMVFFNYNGIQYKYYPTQCKVFKKCGRKYQRIKWKDFAEENNPDGQKQNSGRSPPFTPDIRSINIDKFKIKE